MEMKRTHNERVVAPISMTKHALAHTFTIAANQLRRYSTLVTGRATNGISMFSPYAHIHTTTYAAGYVYTLNDGCFVSVLRPILI